MYILVVKVQHTNMISFGIMSMLLVVMACVVHYDLLGLFPTYPFYRKPIYVTNNQQYNREPDLESTHIWIPGPGTNPTADAPSFHVPTIVLYDSDDSDDFWVEVTDPDDHDTVVTGAAGDTPYSVNSADGTKSGTYSVHDGTSVDTFDHSLKNDDDDDDYNYNNDDDDDYEAPGEERDDVF